MRQRWRTGHDPASRLQTSRRLPVGLQPLIEFLAEQLVADVADYHDRPTSLAKQGVRVRPSKENAPTAVVDNDRAELLEVCSFSLGDILARARPAARKPSRLAKAGVYFLIDTDRISCTSARAAISASVCTHTATATIRTSHGFWRRLASEKQKCITSRVSARRGTRGRFDAGDRPYTARPLQAR